jgi:acyl carrier protein
LPSGKLDRRALLAIASQRSEDDERPAAPPRSRIEIAIARIWCDILKLGRVGLQTNFFDQGGHSLLLLQVQDRIEEELKLHVAVTDLFKYPTVETLARCLAQQESRVNLEADREPVGRRRADARQAALRQIGDRRRLQSAAGDPQ